MRLVSVKRSLPYVIPVAYIVERTGNQIYRFAVRAAGMEEWMLGVTSEREVFRVSF